MTAEPAEPPALECFPLDPEGVEAFAQHLLARPELPEGARAYCQAYLSDDTKAEPGRKLMHQHARYITAFILIRNYYAWRDGGGAAPTLSLLKELSGLSSRHTANLVATLRAGRLVEDQPIATDQRIKLLKPAPELVFSVGRSQICFAELADRLDRREPERGAQLRRDADALGGLLRVAGDYLAQYPGILTQFPNVLNLSRFDCGYEVLMIIMLAHYAQQSGQETPSLSQQALSRRFGISTSHAGNIVAALRADGTLELGPRGQFQGLADKMVHEFHHWCAAQTAHTILLCDGPLSRLQPPTLTQSR